MKIPGPVVLIDDDADDQEMFKYVLKKIGTLKDLRLFSNGVEALNYLSTTNEKPFVIICDINMPMMNGLEFRATVNANEYLRQKSIPFIFLTTAAMPEHVKLAYELTVQGFFIKSGSMSELEDNFKQIFNYWRNCVHPNMI